MRRLPSSVKLPTVKLRHKRDPKRKLILNASEYAARIGLYARDWNFHSYRAGEASDDQVEMALKQAQVEWEKRAQGRDDRDERRFEHRKHTTNLILPPEVEPVIPVPEEMPVPVEPTPPAPAPVEQPATTPTASQENSTKPAPSAGKEPLAGPQHGLIYPPKRGRPKKL